MLPPLLFTPIYRRYIWGGRRFAAAFGRPLPPGDDYAESWELVDRGGDQSIVRGGPLAGRSLGEIVRGHGAELFGRSPPAAFPLLFKFLDANRVLSVQVHPDDARAARLDPPDRGKTEAWYVVAAEPGSRIYAGLREGVDQAALAAAIRSGTCETVLHSFAPVAGDCVFIPAGTVHAIGAGLLVAEIQQSSDVTYRLFDWNRTGPDGKPRPLHVEAGVEAVTRLGPVDPVRPEATGECLPPEAPDGAAVRRLVACEYFSLEDVRPMSSWRCGGDGRCHVVAVIEGEVRLHDQWGLPTISAGDCVLLPAAAGGQEIAAAGAKLLHITVP